MNVDVEGEGEEEEKRGEGAPGEQVDVDEHVLVLVEEVGAQRLQHQVAHRVGLRAQDHHCAHEAHR